MNDNDKQVLAMFMRDALFNKKDEPDLSMLAGASDAGVIDLASQLAVAMQQQTPIPENRSKALESIERLIHEQYKNANAPQEVHVPEVRYTNGYGEQTSNSSVRERRVPVESMDVRQHITPRVLRFYRHFSGWRAITAFFESQQKSYSAVRNHHQPLVDEAIKEESLRYQEKYLRKYGKPPADDEVTSYIQAEYIAQIMPADRNSNADYNRFRQKPPITIDIDLSPRAQNDISALMKKHKMPDDGTYSQAKDREGWVIIERCQNSNHPYHHIVTTPEKRRHVVRFLDNQIKKKATQYQKEHACSQEEAVLWVNENYMYRSESLKGLVRRVLSPEALADAERYIREEPYVGGITRHRNKGTGILSRR